METKFFFCRHCGNVVQKHVNSGKPLSCCGEPMTELTPNTVEASQEKHLPVVTRLDNCNYCVDVGSSPHPMFPEHHIDFIYLETECGGQIVHLHERPEAVFCTCKSRPKAVYEYCNIHGLWKKEV